MAAQLTRILFPVLLEIYSASADPGVRLAVPQAMLRMVMTTEAEILEQVLNPPSLSSQVAAILSSQDLKIIVSALQISENLLTKLPDQFSVHFRREGVLHQVQKLTDPDYSISANETSLDSSLNISWSHSSPQHHAAGALAGGPVPASLLGLGMALLAALGEAVVGDSEEADMRRLQVTP